MVGLDEDTIQMSEEDTLGLLDAGDTDVLELMLGDENVVLDERGDAQSDGTPDAPLRVVWDSREIARVAVQLARYRYST